jgi:hydroxypyruvate reductase
VSADAGGRQHARNALEDLWRQVLAAAEPGRLLRAALSVENGLLRAGPFTVELATLARLLVLGCGKAGGAMAQATEAILGDRITDGFAVVKDGYVRPTTRIQLAEARHPVPDARGEAAASRLLAMASAAAERDLILFLVSGGGSALTPAPAPPVTLEEKQAVTRALLGAGAPIGELNAVRKHLSRIKGGQLARAASPAHVVTLALSDVIGDPLDVIASGPTAPDPTTFDQALEIIERRIGIDAAPHSVVERLRAGTRGAIAETPKPGDPLFERVANVVIGNNDVVADAAIRAATRLGWRPQLVTCALEGEARDAAVTLVREARSTAPGTCLLASGETTVTVRGRGRGGRCQEFALAAAVEIRGTPDIVVLAAGTDGTDGPTDAAGAIVDGDTVMRARANGVDPSRALANNDAYTVLRVTGDLLITGPTNTNLLDLYLVLRT